MSEPKTVTITLPASPFCAASIDWRFVVEQLRAPRLVVLGDIADQIEAQLPKPDTFGYSAVIKDTKGRIWQNNRHGKDYTHFGPWYCVDTEECGEFSDFAVAEVLSEGVPFDKLDNATEEVPW